MTERDELRAILVNHALCLKLLGDFLNGTDGLADAPPPFSSSSSKLFELLASCRLFAAQIFLPFSFFAFLFSYSI